MKTILALFYSLFLMLSTSASAALINANFYGAGFSGSAVVGGASDYWNYAYRGVGTVNLLDSQSQLSGVSLSIVGGNGNWNLSGGSGFAGTPYYNLMNNFIYTGGTPIQLLFSGLTAGSHYSFYLFGQSDHNSHFYGTTTTVGSETKTANYQNLNYFLEDTNYQHFQGIVGSTGQLSVLMNVAPGKSQAMTNGFQLELSHVADVADPSITGMIVLALLMMFRRKPRLGRQDRL